MYYKTENFIQRDFYIIFMLRFFLYVVREEKEIVIVKNQTGKTYRFVYLIRCRCWDLD